MTMEQAWGLAPGTKLIYHHLTTSITDMVVVREPVTAYFVSVSASGKRVEIIRLGIGRRAVDPRWLELPAGEPVVDERMVKVFGKKRGETK